MSEAGDGLGQRLSSRIKSSPCQVKRDVRKRTINERKIECNTEHFIAPTIRHLAEVTLLLCPTSRSVIRKWIVAGEAATDSSWGKLWLSRSRIHSAHQCCHHRSPGNLIIRELRKRKRYIALASSSRRCLASCFCDTRYWIMKRGFRGIRWRRGIRRDTDCKV